MKKYLVEFIGTFFLVLTVVLAVHLAGNLAPIAIGSILMVMIYAGGHISGAHYNPAVTLAVWMRGKCDTSDVPGYMISQFVGGALAALAAGFLLSGKPDVAAVTGGSIPIAQSILAEVLGTFALAYVVLNTATSKGTAGNSFYGLAIGFTVLACAYGLGGISGGAFNPAVALGINVAEMSLWSNIWVYLVACFGGGALAALVFNFVKADDDV